MRQVLLIPDMEDGGYIVEVPSLPGCRSEGDTVEEALINIRDAIDLYIESMIAHEEEVPEDVAQILIFSV
jgi:predicted RNase H-like HicB family nuclease